MKITKDKLKNVAEEVIKTRKDLIKTLPSGSLGRKVYRGNVPKNTYSKRFF
jgi:hypothetical protein